jgi:hypothetical protein
MKKVLLLTLAVLMISNVAMADHIGYYSDCSGGSCLLAPGFSTTSAIVHKFSYGATYSRWKVVLPTGSSLFSFTTQNAYPSIGVPGSDLSVAYGQCNVGSWCVGTLVAQLANGVARVEAADGQLTVLWADCNFGEFPGTGGSAWVGGTPDCGDIATEQSTWGGVKALYR